MTENAIVVQQSSYLSPAVDISGAMARYDAMNRFISGILKDGTDYGKVPGSDKPTLLKPGAEKLASFFGLTPRFILDEKVEDWTGENHGGEPFFYYRYKCQLFKGDLIIAEGDGSCNSWEKKYRYRQAQRTCPECGQPAIFKSKNKPEFYCWNKKGGCGATFKLNDPRIADQETGQTKNPDPAEQVNTIQKMAQKRALIAPVLIATNASEKFTQDIEDFVDTDYHDVVDVAPKQKPVMNTTPTQEPEFFQSDAPQPELIPSNDPYANVCNEQGEPYSTLSLDKLSYMATSLVKNKARTDEDNRKLEAAKYYMAQKRKA